MHPNHEIKTKAASMKIVSSVPKPAVSARKMVEIGISSPAALKFATVPNEMTKFAIAVVQTRDFFMQLKVTGVVAKDDETANANRYA